MSTFKWVAFVWTICSWLGEFGERRRRLTIGLCIAPASLCSTTFQPRLLPTGRRWHGRVCTGRWSSADWVVSRCCCCVLPCSARVCLGYVHCAVVLCCCGESWAKPRHTDQRCSRPPCSGHQPNHHQLCHRYARAMPLEYKVLVLYITGCFFNWYP